jgi:hypothetical protein
LAGKRFNFHKGGRRGKKEKSHRYERWLFVPPSDGQSLASLKMPDRAAELRDLFAPARA